MSAGTERLITKSPHDPPVRVAKLGFHVVSTRDVGAIASHYEEWLGMARTDDGDGQVAYLTTGTDHHTVRIEKGEANGRAGVGFEIHGSLDEAAERLEKAGVACERRSDPEPGIRSALVVTEPDTEVPITLYEAQEPAGLSPVVGGVRPTKLGHIASYLPDLAIGHDFYLGVLGFGWSDTLGDFFSFLRCNADHHAVNLLESRAKTGLFHVAYEVRDLVHLRDALDHLASGGHRMVWGPGRHGPGHNIFTYHRDPDGNLIELFTELDRIADQATGLFEPRPWHEEWPQYPKFWVPEPDVANSWGWSNPDFEVR